MRLEIQALSLRNFKGVGEFSISFSRKNRILGTNASGKTTISDAIHWLLFGKNAVDKADFKIKPLEQDGNDVHNTVTEVEGSFVVDGQDLVFRRSYQEKWTRKTGQVTPALTGHTTSYEINGVPAKEKEFKAKVESIIDENTFKLLSNPRGFNAIPWAQRRKILMDVGDGVSDVDVIDSDPAFSPLVQILNNHGLDKERERIKASQKALNKRLKEIPARIDELKKTLKKITPPTAQEKTVLEKKINEAQLKMVDKEGTALRNEVEKQLIQVDRAIAEEEQKAAIQETNLKYRQRERLSGIKQEKASLGNRLSVLKNEKVRINNDISQKKQVISELRATWHETYKTKFTGEEACPYCGAAYSPEKIKKAQASFNADKSETLASINARGKKLGAVNSDLESRLEEIDREIKIIEGQASEAQALFDQASRELEGIKVEPDIKALQDQRLDLIGQLEQGKPDFSGVEAEIEALKQSLSQIEIIEATLKSQEKTEKRVAELMGEEKKLARLYEQEERNLSLIERFDAVKIGLTEEVINSKFEKAHFRLFKTLINGAIKPCCETLFEGVPYLSDLNTGAQIEVGLDIIKTLSAHYGIETFVIIDNAESVVDITDIGVQQIQLIVSSEHKKITIMGE